MAKLNGGYGVTLVHASVLKNSRAEIFTMQKYVGTHVPYVSAWNSRSILELRGSGSLDGTHAPFGSLPNTLSIHMPS
jgi:hypothetical protein